MAPHWRDDERRGWQGRGNETYERRERGAPGGRPGSDPQRTEPQGSDPRGPDMPRRDMPYSHGGTGHRQRDRLGGSGQGGYESGGYDRDDYASGEYESGGYGPAESRWGRFGGPGGPDGETWGPRPQRSLGHWRDSYGSGEAYGRGGGPAGEMDYDRGDYGRDRRGGPMGGAALQGPHRGKGPKGYERSAERLKEDICERLTEAPDVDAGEIAIAVRDGVVTLDGSVASRPMKHRAEDIVAGCLGVKDIENKLKVLRPGQAAPSPGQPATQPGGSQAGSDSPPETTGRPPRFGPLRH